MASTAHCTLRVLFPRRARRKIPAPNAAPSPREGSSPTERGANSSAECGAHAPQGQLPAERGANSRNECGAHAPQGQLPRRARRKFPRRARRKFPRRMRRFCKLFVQYCQMLREYFAKYCVFSTLQNIIPCGRIISTDTEVSFLIWRLPCGAKYHKNKSTEGSKGE